MDLTYLPSPPADMAFIPSEKHHEESFNILGNKEECRRFGMAAEFYLRDYVIAHNHEILLFPPEYTGDWAFHYTLYDVKCSEDGCNTHTVTRREKKAWDAHIKNGHDVIIWSCKRNIDGKHVAFIKEISYEFIIKHNLLMPSHKKLGNWYFYID